MYVTVSRRLYMADDKNGKADAVVTDGVPFDVEGDLVNLEDVPISIMFDPQNGERRVVGASRSKSGRLDVFFLSTSGTRLSKNISGNSARSIKFVSTAGDYSDADKVRIIPKAAAYVVKAAD